MCPVCNRYFKDKDRVLLDQLNTVIHQNCYEDMNFPIIDSGTYRSTIEKYNYFESLR